MFVPPNVANTKAAQAHQSLAASNVANTAAAHGPEPRPATTVVADAIDVVDTATGRDKQPRKKSDPVLSSSAPASVGGERPEPAGKDAIDNVDNNNHSSKPERKRLDSRSTGNTRSSSPVEGPLFGGGLAALSLLQTQTSTAPESPPIDCPVLCLNEVHFGHEENKEPLSSQPNKEANGTAAKNDFKDGSSKDGRDSRDGSTTVTALSSTSTSTLSLQILQNSQANCRGGSPSSTPAPEAKKKPKKNRKSPWFQNLISPTYKSKCADFRRLFAKEGVPESEMLIVDYSCALQRDILVHGRLYVSQNYFCFHANIFKWETVVVLKCRDLTSMTKEKTALVIPNAIVCQTENERFFFTSFAARDKTYLMLFRIWQNALLAQPMSTPECWRWVHYSYGDELGLSTDDEDYVAPDDFVNYKPIIDIKGLADVTIDEAELAHPDSPTATKQYAESLLSSGDALTKAVTAITSEDAKSSASSGDDAADEDGGVQRKTAAHLGGSSVLPECPESHDDTKLYLDKCFAMDIDHLFTCMFTASEFYQDLQASRNITNMTIGNWERLADAKTSPTCEEGERTSSSFQQAQCKQKRSLAYTVNLNHAMAKVCTSTETQYLHRKSKPGKMYSIRTEVSNTGVPYADTFVVQQHYCLRREGENRCRLKVFAQIDFRKPPWGFVKSMIEKSTHQGVSDFVADLEKALEQEATRLATDSGQVSLSLAPEVSASLTTKSGFPSIQTIAPRGGGVCGGLTGPDAKSWPAVWFSHWLEPTTLLRVMTVLVGVLLASTSYLLYLHWMRGNQGSSWELVDFDNHPPTTLQEWKAAYEQSQLKHGRQLEEVNRLLSRSLGGIENMQAVFGQLREVIAQRATQLILPHGTAVPGGVPGSHATAISPHATTSVGAGQSVTTTFATQSASAVDVHPAGTTPTLGSDSSIGHGEL